MIILIGLLNLNLTPPHRMLTRKDSLHRRLSINNDIEMISQLFEFLHPSAFYYLAKDSLRLLTEKGVQQYGTHPDKLQAWRLLQPLVASIGCGHTSLMPAANVLSEFSISPDVLPFRIKIRNHHVFIQEIVSPGAAAGLVTEDEIIRINKIPILLILDKLRKYISADGNNNAYKDFQLECGSFNFLYNILLKGESDFHIDILHQGALKSINLRGVDYHLFKKTSAETCRPYLSFGSTLKTTAVLAVRHLSYDDFASIHQRVFAELRDKHIENLILDLRNNQGGRESIAVDLMSYLVKKKFIYAQSYHSNINSDQLMQLMQSGRDTLPGLAVQYHPNHTINRGVLHRPQRRPFEGRVFMAINGGTFSAGTLLAVALKSQSTVTAIGQETGGARAGCAGGSIKKFILPYSGLLISIPTLWTRSPGTDQQTGIGLIPDIACDFNDCNVSGSLSEANDRLINSITKCFPLPEKPGKQ